ncbi:MAG: hypothetical protein K2G89_09030 [Lachnospiraceae bacterium]|nr:hypothetical protein [Lachnospiraceae bacterium]
MTFIRLEKIFILGLCLCAAMICLTACGREKIVYNTEETENNNETPLQQEIPEHIEEVINTERGKITIDADVLNVQNFEKLPAATVVIKDWSEQDIKNYAEAVFDKGSVEYVLPFWCWSMDDLMDEEAKVKEQIKELGFTEETVANHPEYGYLEIKLLDLRFSIQSHDDSKVLENDGSFQWISAEDGRMTCQAKGTINGQEYGMLAEKSDEDSRYSLSFFQVKGEHYAEDDTGHFDIPGGRWLSPNSVVYNHNECKLSEQEAINRAQDFINQMGIQDMTVSGVYQALRYMYNTDENGNVDALQALNGYYVYFGRALQGCTTPAIKPYVAAYCYDTIKTETEGGSIEYSQGDSHYGYESIAVLVTDNGIEEFCYLNPMEVSEELVEQSKVMEFGKIYEIAKEYLQIHKMDCEIDTIRLCLGRVKYEDSYALIPVWSFEYNDSFDSVEWYPQAVLINAIDGSLIDADSGRPMN